MDNEQHKLTIFRNGRTYIFTTLTEIDQMSAMSDGEDSLRAPIPGNIAEVFVQDGSDVEQGEPILVLEAMKMEYTIRAPAKGRVVAVLFGKGDSVQERQRLVRFEASSANGEVADETA